ncbi:transposase mutator type [Amycolatopsis japonica]|uniref:Mutator family transposase n=1 Tax=Amycolatopsis japonica TaxID=208439 RepID=A0A075UL88_9PSEU|nr:transposase mutator type [Amycolatopsis japonica]
MLKLFTKNVLETALNEQMTEHLGHEKNQADPDRESTNVRNGSRSKTVISDAAGEVGITVPRDRESTVEPQVVKKRQRRLTEVDEIVLSLYAKGMTTADISVHFAEIYGSSVSKETISRITDKVVAEMNDWANRPLDPVYVAVFIDAIHVKIRDGQVANRPVYAAIGVTVDGHKDLLGLWVGTGGEGAKFWMSVLIDLKTRHRGCVLPRLRRPQGPARGRDERVAANNCSDLHRPLDPQHVPACVSPGLGCGETRHKPIYTAPSPDAAAAALDEFEEKWGATHRAVIRLWRNAWNEFTPFLDYDVEIRTMICSTNAIESLNARYRRVIRARGHFPTEQAAMKCLYLVTRSLDPTGTGRARWTMRWKPVINAFAITFGDRWPGAETY